ENKDEKIKSKIKNSLHEVVGQKIESPKNKQMKISAKEYFGFNEESTPKQTEIRATRITEPIKNTSIWGTLNSLLRQLIFEDLRGKLGGTYSPHVRLDKNLGHHAWSVSVGVKPELTKQAEEIIKNNILKIALADKKDKDLKSRFEETQKMRLENILTLESSAGEIADFAIDDLANFEKIKNVNEGLRERLAVTFEDVCSLAKKELLPEKLFWFIEEP
ncbi:MAG: hypothetical protein Q7R78_00155, partial [bacterium]|nr:hypothetical protein [bacterium]